MRKFVKRIAAAASAVVIGGVSCVTTWFSVPVVAFGAVDLYNVFQLFQMLTGVVMPHIHLDGDGPDSSGNYYYTVQDWWDDNFVKKYHYDQWDADLTAYDDLMYRMWDTLGVDDMVKLVDSWNEVYDDGYAGVADVGTDVSGSDFVYDGLETYDGLFRFSKPLQFISKSYPDMKNGMFFNPSDATPYVVLVPVADSSLSPPYRVYQIAYFSSSKKWDDTLFSINYMHLGTSGSCWTYVTFHPSLWEKPQQFSNGQSCWSMSDAQKFLNVIGIDGSVVYDNVDQAVSFLNSNNPDWQPGKTGTDSFIGPVFFTPAAQQLAKEQGTLTGIRLDVQTDTGAPDIDAALNHAGVGTVDDLINGVAKGDIPMSQVYADTKVVPYVLTDVDTGEIVTDLTVPATAANVKSVALDKDLAIPKDITAADAYEVKGKTWDPEMSKYRLPLFQYFPFCLPWDIYQVLAAFSADPVAPVFDIPVGKILSGVRSADVSKAASLSAKIDFGDDNWSKVFEVIRILECAGIIVGLCLVAVYLIHGGR